MDNLEEIDISDANHDINRKLIRTIFQYPSIWNKKHPTYMNKNIKSNDWKSVTSEMQEIDNGLFLELIK